VVLASVRTQVFSRHVFTDHGIDPLQRRVLVVKSTQHFANDFGKFAAHIVRCDGPGTLTADLASLPYTRIRRPMLGLDDVATVDLEAMPAVPIRRR
jgi:microcystin degradation protein MlrC